MWQLSEPGHLPRPGSGRGDRHAQGNRGALERIHLLQSAESADVEFPELGPIHLLVFGPEDALPAYFVALAREPDRSAEQRTQAIENALRLVASDAERERLRALAASSGLIADDESPETRTET